MSGSGNNFPFKSFPGGKRGHKGGRKQFTDPQALERDRLKEQKEKEWRRRRGEDVDDDDESEDESGSEEESKGAAGASAGASKKKGETSSEEESSEEESSDDDDKRKTKGAEALIEIENPNRVQKKFKKAGQVDLQSTKKPELSRREREEIEKQKAKERYQKLHAQGKTEEARADLARLAIVRKQREEAAKKREEERLGELFFSL